MLTTGCGSDSISTAFEEKVNDFLIAHGAPYKLAKGYAMTEACAAACTCFEDKNKLQSVGLPLCKTVIAIFDSETGKELSYYTEGEICIQSPTVMLGYFAHDEDTENVLRKHDDGTIWFHIGDIGCMDEDGFLFFKGRIKRIIIRYNGYKIYPAIVENVLSGLAEVEDCAVVGIPDMENEQGSITIAFIVGNQNQEELEKKLLKLCENELPQYEHPAKFIFLKELPRTSIGKVDFRALEEQAKGIQ